MNLKLISRTYAHHRRGFQFVTGEAVTQERSYSIDTVAVGARVRVLSAFINVYASFAIR